MLAFVWIYLDVRVPEVSVFCSDQLALFGMLNATMDLTRLTRKHSVRIAPGFSCSVEECSLAVGRVA